ncbi:Polysaccharide deacetylase [Papillibacter cinnamivorans DSM 12816]|uniref:Polysaccharide deacetylase n=2 Tax=Papillibacter TaxID=100175 RepID=A0A1W2A791_9FIRM|nr:Polysaccharide deacetylase [Papillibacter cinnamivorans DSM 12816]
MTAGVSNLKKAVLLLFLIITAAVLTFRAASRYADLEGLKPGSAQQSETGQSAGFPAEGIPVLLYHSIRSEANNPMCVFPEQFREEMDWLKEHKYHTLTLEEFYNTLTGGGEVPENPVLITFDDGYADNYQTAWPILRQHGFTAAFFIVTDYVGPYRISWEQLKELSQAGISIGSHSVSHRDLSALTRKQQEEELEVSRQLLEDNLGIPLRAFCYPYGKYNKTTMKLLGNLEYRMGFTTRPGRVHAGDDLFQLRRIYILGGIPLSEFIEKVSA